MVELRQARVEDAERLAPLVLMSAQTLLPFVFGDKCSALNYLKHALVQEDGQYSAKRHIVAYSAEGVIGSMSLWKQDMPNSFHLATVKSLTGFLSDAQIKHVIAINDDLIKLFPAPKTNEMCLGHLAVSSNWQGRQVASQLLAFALRRAKMANKTRLVLDVDAASETAIAFYQKRQFIKETERDYRPTKQTFYRMVLDLT